MASWNAGISSFSRSVAGLKGLADKVAEDLQKDIADDLQQKFRSGKDPYGTAWKRRKHQYAHPILRKSGNLYRSLDVDTQGSKVIVKRTAAYGSYHQSGTKRLPIRLIVPIQARGTPTSWNPFFRKRVARQFKKLFP